MRARTERTCKMRDLDEKVSESARRDVSSGNEDGIHGGSEGSSCPFEMREEDSGEGGGRERSARQMLSRRTVLALAKGIGLLALAFLFARCEWFLSTRPFGLALLCAAEGGLGWIYGGFLLAALPILGTGIHPISAVVATATVLLRVAARMTIDLPWKRGEEPDVRSFDAFCKELFREHIALRMAIGSIAAFLTGLYRMVGGGYRVYDLLSSLFSLVALPIAVYLLGGLWQRGVSSLAGLRCVTTVLGTLGMIVLAFSGMSLYGISLSVFTALGATLWITHRKGISYGILGGLLFGLLIDPISAPLYAFAALSAGALRRVSVFMGALCALSVGMAWGFYVYGLGALSMLFPALLASSLLFCVLERLGLLPGRAPLEDGTPPLGDEVALPRKGESGAEEHADIRSDEMRAEEDRMSILRSSLAAERLHDEERKIEDLCGAFLSVSDLLRALTESSKYPSAEEFRRVCDRVCDEFCPSCVSCTQCWGSEYARMAGTLGHMADELHENGRVDVDAFPEEVRRRCKMSGAIFLRINEEAGELTAAYLKRERAGLLSADYSAAASLFRSASKGSPERYEIDNRKSRDGERFFAVNGVHPSRVAVSGGRCGCLYAWGVEERAVRALFSSDEKRREFLGTFGFLPSEPILTPIPGGGGLCDLRVPATPRYRVRNAYVSRPSCHNGREEGLCGDSITVFESCDGRLFSLLSDGMGSGRRAAQLSGICTVFLQKMLTTGGDTGVILRMLNDFLAAGAVGEVSATVDLLEIDLFTGEGTFWKSGAAPSFVYREGNLLRLSSRTAPVGILSETDVQKTAFRLYSGDVVVMLSDGVVDGHEDGEFLETMLDGTESSEGLRRAAERIADARRYASPAEAEHLDDRSVILLSVEEVDKSREEPVRAVS